MPHIQADDGARVFYRLDGPEDGPALLLSNSLGTALELWEPQIPAFAARFRVLRYDSRGHGRSDAPEGPYTIERLGRDALSLLDGLGIASAHICGLSKGGMVAMWLAIHVPERVERLVLCNTSAHIGDPEVWNERIATVRQHGMAAVAPAVIERWFTEGFRTRHPETVERIAAMLRNTPPEGYVACCAAVRDMDQRADLDRIRAPTLIAVGRHDPVTPIEHARVIAERVPGARIIDLDAAHLSNIEAEAAFTEAVLDHLAP